MTVTSSIELPCAIEGMMGATLIVEHRDADEWPEPTFRFVLNLPPIGGRPGTDPDEHFVELSHDQARALIDHLTAELAPEATP